MNKERVLLLHAPFKDYTFGDKWRETECLSPPLGLLYMASPLVKNCYNVEFIDLNVKKLEREEFIQIVKKNDFFLISCYSQSLKNVEKIIQDIKKINSNAFIIVGGPYCNINEKYVIGSDITVIGEAEQIIVKILELVKTNKSLDGIPGLIYNKDGKIKRNSGIIKVDDLNLSDFPLIELAKNHNYGNFYGIKLDGIMGIMSSRGCPFNCTFCTHKTRFNYRERTAENVVQELKEMVKMGYKYIFFYDDNFLLNKKRVIKIMNMIIQENLKIKMVIQGRVDSADYNLYKKLKEAGVIMIVFGIESANQDVLDFYNKQTTVEKMRSTINLVNKVGILSFGHLIIGAPFETKEHFENDKKFVNSINLDFIQVKELGYYYGSKLWEDAYNRGLIKKGEIFITPNKNLSNFSYEELLDIKKKFYHDFYNNPVRLLRIFYKLVRVGEFSLFFKGLFLKNILSRKDDAFSI